eukprot:CAMPEP_0180692488 /NCGR_PEP_ID=MMETSP1038_2-20121128/846_1 /TAXON_ID=632150 /ORGANISM="Azadinium spinosum, Strain 3D9" /LENGTH=104 /DNA_ID=CAMNT_0022723651 /DNA_START=123 /DNA_END=434 /DNA_ORIENTATION=+
MSRGTCGKVHGESHRDPSVDDVPYCVQQREVGKERTASDDDKPNEGQDVPVRERQWSRGAEEEARDTDDPTLVLMRLGVNGYQATKQRADPCLHGPLQTLDPSL